MDLASVNVVPRRGNTILEGINIFIFLEDYVEDIIGTCHRASCEDVCLMEEFRCGLDDDCRFILPCGDPCWTLQSYVNFALWTNGSSFTVGEADEDSNLVQPHLANVLQHDPEPNQPPPRLAEPEPEPEPKETEPSPMGATAQWIATEPEPSPSDQTCPLFHHPMKYLPAWISSIPPPSLPPSPSLCLPGFPTHPPPPSLPLLSPSLIPAASVLPPLSPGSPSTDPQLCGGLAAGVPVSIGIMAGGSLISTSSLLDSASALRPSGSTPALSSLVSTVARWPISSTGLPRPSGSALVGRHPAIASELHSSSSASVLCHSGSAADLRISALVSRALALRILGVPQDHQLSVFTSGSTFTSVGRPPGVVSPFSSTAPPSVGFAMGYHHGCGLDLIWLILLRVPSMSTLAPSDPRWTFLSLPWLLPPPSLPWTLLSSSRESVHTFFSTTRGRAFPEWGVMSHPYEEIDEESFMLLNDGTITNLIPRVRLFVKFLKYHEELVKKHGEGDCQFWGKKPKINGQRYSTSGPSHEETVLRDAPPPKTRTRLTTPLKHEETTPKTSLQTTTNFQPISNLGKPPFCNNVIKGNPLTQRQCKYSLQILVELHELCSNNDRPSAPITEQLRTPTEHAVLDTDEDGPDDNWDVLGPEVVINRVATFLGFLRSRPSVLSVIWFRKPNL
ncbi:hypothetical protein H4Q32_027566 [Labeo rohita]|uniref:Uncharacterized protein n=1 Tax=Labeo rohita TaxID=84645 RepID=A0ABQ8MGJ6_LABRO|nr:hypothetical protein H4Q32_027566 [Labeo rohita]